LAKILTYEAPRHWPNVEPIRLWSERKFFPFLFLFVNTYHTTDIIDLFCTKLDYFNLFSDTMNRMFEAKVAQVDKEMSEKAKNCKNCKVGEIVILNNNILFYKQDCKCKSEKSHDGHSHGNAPGPEDIEIMKRVMQQQLLVSKQLRLHQPPLFFHVRHFSFKSFLFPAAPTRVPMTNPPRWALDYTASSAMQHRSLS